MTHFEMLLQDNKQSEVSRRARLKANVQVLDQVWKVSRQVGSQINDQVWDQVRDQVHEELYDTF